MHCCYYLGVCLLLLALSPSLTSGDDDLDPLAKKLGSKFASFFPPTKGGAEVADSEKKTKRIKCVRTLDGDQHVFKCPQFLRAADGSIVCDIGACYALDTKRTEDYTDEQGCYCAPNPDLMNKCVTLTGADEGYDVRMCWCDAQEFGCCNAHDITEDRHNSWVNETTYPREWDTKGDKCRNYDDYVEAKKEAEGKKTTTKEVYDGRGSEFGEGHSFQPSAKSIFLALTSLVFLKALVYTDP